MNKVLTFIMAGGKGERLFPLTKDRTKPAVPFAGVYRIIDITLSNCINSGLRKIHVLTQYKSYSLTRHISRGWNVLNGELGEYIDAIPAQQRVDEHWYKGTADSIYQNIYAIEDEVPDYILILAGDHVYKMDYRDMINFHIQSQADLTIGVVEVSKEKATGLGICRIDESNRVSELIEKPSQNAPIIKDSKKILASMGIYVFNREVLEDVLEKDAKLKESSHDFAKDIIPSMLKKYNVVAYNFVNRGTSTPSYWRDIGDIDAYYEANMDLLKPVPEFNLYDKKWPYRTYQEQFGPSKTISESNTTGYGMALNCLISNGCIINCSKVQSSILSPDVKIDRFSEISDSIIMEGVEIDRDVKIRRAIIDKYVKISSGSRIGFDPIEDKKRFKISASGIVVIPKNAIV